MPLIRQGVSKVVRDKSALDATDLVYGVPSIEA